MHSNLSKYVRRLPPNARRLIRRTIEFPERFAFWMASQGIYRNSNHERLLALRDKHRGERCFIIGNGPSLNKMDLYPLRDEITFGSNAFFLAYERVGFLPTYYTVEDPLPAEDNSDTLNDLTGTIKIFPTYLKYCLKPTSNTIYVYFDRFYNDHSQLNWPLFSDNVLRCVYWGGTVLYMSLQLAYYMGIRETYLIGVDLDYKLPENVSGDVIVSKSADLNHFHPDYFGPGKRWHHPKVERMAKAFKHAGKVFETKGGMVYNATVGGKLNSLPRVSYSEILKLQLDNEKN